MGLGILNSLNGLDAPCRRTSLEAEAWLRHCTSPWKSSSSCSSCSSSSKRHLSSFEGYPPYDQGGYGGYGGYGEGGQGFQQQGLQSDYDADADEDPAAEEARAEKEEVLNETLGKAKQVMDVIKQVDTEIDASKAQLVEIGAKAIDFKARFRFRNAAMAANVAHEIAAHPGEVNKLLVKLTEDSQKLEDMMHLTEVGKPFRFRTKLIKLAGDAERASQLMDQKIDKLKEALRTVKHAGGEHVDVEDEGGEGTTAEGEGEEVAETPEEWSPMQPEAQGQGVHDVPSQMSGAYGGMPGELGQSPEQAQQAAQQMVIEEKMVAAQEAAMSGATATTQDEEAVADMEPTAMNTTSTDALPKPQPSDVELQEQAPRETGLPVPQTSSGCSCDPVARCALQGQPFYWCRVGTEEEPCGKVLAADDPTGRDHSLGTDRHWDYCVPPAPGEEAGKVPADADANGQEEELTAHVGCECAPRLDVLEKYREDPLFHNLETGEIALQKVPFKDRITIEAMLKYENGEDLCQQTPSSGQFLVCPAAKDCAGSNVTGPGGALPSGWFSGVSGKSWDFCAPAPQPPPPEASEETPDQGATPDEHAAHAAYDQNAPGAAYGAAYGAPGVMHYQWMPEMSLLQATFKRISSKPCWGRFL